MAKKGRQLTDKELNSLERKLSKQYATEQKRLQRQIGRKMLKFNVQDKSRRLLVDNGLMKQEDYDAWRRAELSHGRSVQRLVDEIANNMLGMNERSAESINKSNKRIYRDNYRYGLDSTGVKGKPNKDGVIRKAEMDAQKDLRWNKQKLTSMLMQSIKKGEDVEQIAKRLSGIVEMNRNSAIRSARTFATGTENKALLDSFVAARDAGIAVKKGWRAIIDERTRVSHSMLNGEVQELDDRFSNGLMYPGDPDGEPKEIFNCRCRIYAVLVNDDAD